MGKQEQNKERGQMASIFHERAKKSGDQLRMYIVSISGAAIGMLFISMTDKSLALTYIQKCLVAVAILMFSATMGLALIELGINARRFYEIAKQYEAETPVWNRNDFFRTARLRIMFTYYVTMGLGIVFVALYLVTSII